MVAWQLVALDPGETTGYSVWAVPDDLAEKPVLMSSGQFLTWRGLATILDNDTRVAVVEAFRLFPQHAKAQIGSDFPSSRVIGVAEYLCDQRGIELVMVPAGNKEFYTDFKLAALGYLPYEKGQRHRNRHALDSIRQALHYLHFTRGYILSGNDRRGNS